MLALLGTPLGAGAIAFCVGWMACTFNTPKIDIAEIQRVAIEARDNEWKLRLAEENAVHETRIAAAIKAAQSEPAVGADRGERLRQCSGDKTCREHKDR